jgi:hypothetical protein
MGENSMVVNILKGVGVLFLMLCICLFANGVLGVANGNPRPAYYAAVFAWVGTAPAMFDSRAGFFRRLMASLSGSIASFIARGAFEIVVGALLPADLLKQPELLVPILGWIAVVGMIGQLVVAYFVARAVVKWRRDKSTATAAASA